MAQKARKKTVSKKTAKSPVRKKKVVQRKKAKTTSKKRVVISRTKKKAVSPAIKQNFKKTIDQAFVVIKKIRAQEATIQKKIANTRKKMSSTKDQSIKLNYHFQIESFKMEMFSSAEADYKKLSTYLNTSYGYAFKIGGVVLKDFLNVCQGLSKGINLVRMQKDLQKMKKDV